MGIIYTLFTLWVYGMVIFWGGLFAIKVLACFIDECRVKEVYASVEPTVHVYAKVEQDNSLWRRAEREQEEKELADWMYGEGK